MAMIQSISFTLCLCFLKIKCEDGCFQVNNLPLFRGYGAGINQRIHHKHQAIIPTYKLGCCGNITEWGVDLNPVYGQNNQHTFSFDLQVWRPSPTVNETGCYSLVDHFMMTSLLSDRISETSNHVARVTPSPQDQLQFQPGDVLGFYVESHGNGGRSNNDNGVVLLNRSRYTSELVWHASVASHTVSGSCPYPVGTDGALKASTRAAPVISIATLVYSCTRSLLLSISITPSATISSSLAPDLASTNRSTNNASLIAGTVFSVMVICITVITFVSITFVVIKRRKTAAVCKIDSTTATVLAITNQTYGITHLDTHDHDMYPESSVTSKPMNCTPHVESMLYNAVGPDISEMNSVYAEATSCEEKPLENDYGNLNHKESGSYDVPKELQLDVFQNSGTYVPTSDERSCFEGHYDTYYSSVNINNNKTGFFAEEQIYWSPATTTSDLYSQLASKKYREISKDQIKTTKTLGSGEFGDVYKAVWSISGTTMMKELAVKTLKPGALENDRVRFLQEAAIMGQFNHPNVVKLFGVVTVDDPIMICIELMSRGDLRGYLGTVHSNQHNVRRLEMQLLKFSREIALGMDYLSKKSFVHRDLAARNVLLDDSLTCKIGDFGMARDLEDDTYYTVHSKGGKIPVKWTAPEALFYKKYSSDSDVWSYGMVLFEIWSVGRKPFSDMTNQQVMKKINSGYCQPPPTGCPRAIYKLMVSCWNPLHAKRPPFSKISSTLTSSTSEVLSWRDGDRHLAGQLGGQLSEAKNLYVDLQNMYC